MKKLKTLRASIRLILMMAVCIKGQAVYGAQLPSAQSDKTSKVALKYDNQGWTPLCHAVKTRKLERVIEIIKEGACVQDAAALIIGLDNALEIVSDYHILTYLLARGAGCKGITKKGILNRDLKTDSGKFIIARRGMTPAEYVTTKKFLKNNRACHLVLYALIKSVQSRSTPFENVFSTNNSALLRKVGGCMPVCKAWKIIPNSSDPQVTHIQESIRKLYWSASTCSAYEEQVLQLTHSIINLACVTDLVSHDSDCSIISGVLRIRNSPLIEAVCARIIKSLTIEPGTSKQARKRTNKEYEAAQLTSERVMFLLAQDSADHADTLIAQLLQHHRKQWKVPAQLWDAACEIANDEMCKNVLMQLARHSNINMYDHKGETTLIHLAQDPYDNHRAIKTLVACGADVHQQALDTGSAALHYATVLGNTKIVGALVESGANPHQLNAAGQSAEMINSMIIDHARAFVTKNGDQYNRYQKAIAIADIFMQHELGV